MAMPATARRTPLWATLIFVAGVPRILAAFLLPNAFGDAYAYIKDIGILSAKLSAGTFRLTDLYGFWLPLYQFICALLSVFVGHPFYVGKVVSAIFGIGVCLLVYDISLRLTEHHKASLLAFALIALNPLHIFNSASAMTDVPHAFFVLAAVHFVLKKSWLMAATCIALAGLTRVDSWMIIVLIPLLQFYKERRVSILACLVMLLPPLFWFYVSWKATGNWLACFVARKEYMDWLMQANPTLATHTLSNLARDTGGLLLSTDTAVLIACFAGTWLAAKRMFSSTGERKSENLRAVLSVSLFFFAFLSFIVFAYLTYKQPIIFPRYGLINFALGLPLLPWTFLELTRRRQRWSRRLLTGIIALCLLNAGIQLAYSIGYINRERAHGAIASHLRSQFQTDSTIRIFNDDGTVLALSEIPAENFLSTADAPHDRAGFLNFLKERKVSYLVFIDRQGSTPAQLFPELKDGTGNEFFRPVMRSGSRFLRTEIQLYKIAN